MKIFFIFFAAAALCGCGVEIPVLLSADLAQPKVIAVRPDDGAAVDLSAEVEVQFSKQIDPSSIDNSSLAILKIEDEEKTNNEIAADVADGDAKGIDGLYEINSENNSVVFRSNTPYDAGAKYLVIATGRIVSTEGFPLNQQPGMSPAPFVSSFLVEGNSSADGGGGEGGSGNGGGSSLPRPEFFVINELMYDATGPDTNGDVFIELYGDEGSDISGYKVVFINGADGKPSDTIEMPDGTTIPDDGLFVIADAITGEEGKSHVEAADLIKNFDPQNSPDCVQLLDEEGALVDALGYGTPIVPLASNGFACFEGIPAATVGSGQSLSRTQGIDTDDNSVDFVVLSAPTPGT